MLSATSIVPARYLTGIKIAAFIVALAVWSACISGLAITLGDARNAGGHCYATWVWSLLAILLATLEAAVAGVSGLPPLVRRVALWIGWTLALVLFFWGGLLWNATTEQQCALTDLGTLFAVLFWLYITRLLATFACCGCLCCVGQWQHRSAAAASAAADPVPLSSATAVAVGGSVEPIVPDAGPIVTLPLDDASLPDELLRVPVTTTADTSAREPTLALAANGMAITPAMNLSGPSATTLPASGSPVALLVDSMPPGGSTTVDANKCRICFDADIDVVLLECGHEYCCGSCAKRVKKCPVCRRTIARVVRVFRP